VTFDIGTGENIVGLGCRLDSIMPLPVEVHDVLLGLDRKMRPGNQQMSAAEKAALEFADKVFLANPLGTTGPKRRRWT